MAPRIPANYGQVTFVHEITGDPEPMVCTMGVGPSVDVTIAQDLVEALHVQWGDNVIAGHLPNQLSLIRTELAYHDTGEADDDPFHLVQFSDTVVGPNVDPSVPQNTAFLVHKRTGLSGRHNRGRVYLPCVPESEVNNVGVLTSSYRDVITADFEAFRADVEGFAAPLDGLALYLFHSVGVGELIAPNPTVITAFECDSIVATQRRRLR